MKFLLHNKHIEHIEQKIFGIIKSSLNKNKMSTNITINEITFTSVINRDNFHNEHSSLPVNMQDSVSRFLDDFTNEKFDNEDFNMTEFYIKKFSIYMNTYTIINKYNIINKQNILNNNIDTLMFVMDQCKEILDEVQKQVFSMRQKFVLNDSQKKIIEFVFTIWA